MSEQKFVLSVDEETETDTVTWEKLLEAPVDEVAVEEEVEEEVDEEEDEEDLDLDEPEELLDDDEEDDEEVDDSEFENPFYGPRKTADSGPCGCFS